MGHPAAVAGTNRSRPHIRGPDPAQSSVRPPDIAPVAMRSLHLLPEPVIRLHFNGLPAKAHVQKAVVGRLGGKTRELVSCSCARCPQQKSTKDRPMAQCQMTRVEGVRKAPGPGGASSHDLALSQIEQGAHAKPVPFSHLRDPIRGGQTRVGRPFPKEWTVAMPHRADAGRQVGHPLVQRLG